MLIFKKLKFLIFAIAACLVCVLFFIGRNVYLSKKRAAERPELSVFFPSHPLLYIEINNANNLWKPLVDSRFIKRSAAIDVVKILDLGHAPDIYATVLKKVQAFLGASSSQGLLKQLVSDHFAIALYPYHFRGHNEKTIRNMFSSVIFIGRIADQKTFKDQLLYSLRQLDATARITDRSYQGHPFSMISASGHMDWVSFAFVDNYVVLGMGFNPIYRYFSAMKGQYAPLDHDALFQEMKAKTPNRKNFFMFLDHKHPPSLERAPWKISTQTDQGPSRSFRKVIYAIHDLIKQKNIQALSFSSTLADHHKIESSLYIKHSVGSKDQLFCLPEQPQHFPFSHDETLLYHWSKCSSSLSPDMIRFLVHQISATSPDADQMRSTEHVISLFGEENGFFWDNGASGNEENDWNIFIFSRPRFPNQMKNAFDQLAQQRLDFSSHLTDEMMLLGLGRLAVKDPTDHVEKTLHNEFNRSPLSKNFHSIIFLQCEQAMQNLSQLFLRHQKYFLNKLSEWENQKVSVSKKHAALIQDASGTRLHIEAILQQLIETIGAGEDDSKAQLVIKKLLSDANFKKNLLQKTTKEIEQQRADLEILLSIKNSKTEELTEEGQRQLAENQKAFELKKLQQEKIAEDVRMAEQKLENSLAQRSVLKKNQLEQELDDAWRTLKEQEEEGKDLQQKIQTLDQTITHSLPEEDFLKALIPPIIDAAAEIKKIIAISQINEKNASTSEIKIFLK